MRILVLNWRDGRHPQAGGAENYVHELGRRWVSRGHEVTLIAARPEKGPRIQDTYQSITVVRVGSRASVYPAARREYRRNWKGWADVVIEHINGVPFLSPLYASQPVVAVIHHLVAGIFFEELPLPAALVGFGLERALPGFYRSVPIVTVSPSSDEALRNLGFSANQTRVFPNGVDVPSEAPVYERAEDIVLYLGRLKQYKRIDLLIRAAREVLEARPQARFLIAGRGDQEQELRALISSLSLDDRVELLGYVPDEVKARLFRSAKVIVMTSEREGWGVSITEAAAYGTPAVGFDAPGIRDSIIDGETGVIVRQRDPESLARALAEMLGNEPARRRMADGACARARALSWEKVADDWLEFLARTVEEST